MLRLIEKQWRSIPNGTSKKFVQNEYYAVDRENRFHVASRNSIFSLKLKNAMKRERTTLIECREHWWCSSAWCCRCFCFGWLTFKIPVFLGFLRIITSFSFSLFDVIQSIDIHVYCIRSHLIPMYFHIVTLVFLFSKYGNVIENARIETIWCTIHNFLFIPFSFGMLWRPMSMALEKFMVQ